VSSNAWLAAGLCGLGLGSAACERVDVYAVTAPGPSAPTPSSDSGVLADDDTMPGAEPSTPTDATAPTPSTSTPNPSAPNPSVPSTSAPSTGTPNPSTPNPSTPGTGSAEQDAGAGGSESAGCREPALTPGDTDVTVRVGDSSRSYVLHVPEAYDGTTAVPLIVDFHGIGESGRSEFEASPYPAVTDPQGVIMAFPDGAPGPLGSAWNFGPCCVADVDDLAFARAVVNDITTNACIDPARIYAVGVLTGGGMVQHLACEAADLFAAISPAAFDLLEETAPDCAPARPITVMSFRGTEDDRVPYEGGPSSVVPGMPITFLGAQRSVERWAEINDCTGPLSAEDENGCAFYAGCAEGVDVALCTAYGGGEAPGDARVAWPVLARHSL
jgi:polyhydroxybutyrate depolymerase